MAGVVYDNATRIYPGSTTPAVNAITWTSQTGSSWCWSVPLAAGSPPP
jgi:hypothetical protein